ncbi:histidine phosphatase family protein [Candidatus Roizmanbacteria bacterium]|nr:histidine phosphatase family protein [Candidatus Roizmanbacteria bacterium]
MPESPTRKEPLRGSNVGIDVVFVRHAAREAIDPERIKQGWSPPLTERGIQASREFGNVVLGSDIFAADQYSSVFFTGTSIARTHQTAREIRRGAKFVPNTTVRERFPTKSGQDQDNLLRLQPGGKPWNNLKIETAVQAIKPGIEQKVFESLTAHGKQEFYEAAIAEIFDGLNHDSGKILTALSRHLPEPVALQEAISITTALYDRFLDSDEAQAYSATAHEYLQKLKRTLSVLPNGKQLLIVGVTHDFNLAGMTKWFTGIESLREIGGPPDFLSYLLFKLKTNELGEFHPQLYYNGRQFDYLPNRL